MKISYDSEVDALYIRLIEGKHQCRTLQLTEEIALNIGENELLAPTYPTHQGSMFSVKL